MNYFFKQLITEAKNHILYVKCVEVDKNTIEFDFGEGEKLRIHDAGSKNCQGCAGLHVSDITPQDLLYTIDKALNNTKYRDIFVHD